MNIDDIKVGEKYLFKLKDKVNNSLDNLSGTIVTVENISHSPISIYIKEALPVVFPSELEPIQDFYESSSNEKDDSYNKPNNDGLKNSFYDIPDWVKDVDDLAEYLDLSFDEGNILKTLWVNIGDRHSGTNKDREVNKCYHYAKRRKDRYLNK